ncbi:MAG: mannonate dehydratase [Puia sp.]
MKENRRDFIRKTTSIAAALTAGSSAVAKVPRLSSKKITAPDPVEYIRDAGMQMSLAYFWGIEPRRIALARQMDVLGAVGGINTRMAGLPDGAKAWDYESVMAVKEAWNKQGLTFAVVEGPPALGEKTKLGLEGRDEEIANFITLMKNPSRAGIRVICYNWMPVIGWYRTDKAWPGRGNALVTAFDNDKIKERSNTDYGEISKEQLWANLEYFLKAVIPEAEKYGIKLAMHPDDPQVDEIRGISRIMTTVDNFKRMLDIYPSASNGITMCQGNFSLMGADIPAIVREFGQRGVIHFVHFRNVRGGKLKFEECFHDEGQIDMQQAMQAYYDIGFRGPIRPDHVPTMAGDSNDNAGYSTLGVLYACGYIRGLMEGVVRQK